MDIKVTIDTSKLQRRANNFEKNLAYSTVQALNATAEFVQRGERANLDRKYKVRKHDFVYKLIKVKFATVRGDRAFAEVYVDNTKQRVLLSIFEEGGNKAPAKGKNVAVPVTGEAARPSFGQSVQDTFTFKALKFRRVNLTKAGKRANEIRKRIGIKGRLTNDYFIWAGQKRTFILPYSKQAPYGGVFQRVGPKRDDIRLIYSFRKNPKLAKSLGFHDTAQAAFNEEFQKQFNRFFYKKVNNE